MGTENRPTLDHTQRINDIDKWGNWHVKLIKLADGSEFTATVAAPTIHHAVDKALEITDGYIYGGRAWEAK